MPAAPGPAWPTADLPAASLAPLLRRVDDLGVVEHSRGEVSAPEFGYCTDDAGRALGVASLLTDDPARAFISERCLAQLERSALPGGGFHLRLDRTGVPFPGPPSDDATARAAWGLALASIHAPEHQLSDRSRRLLERAAAPCSSPFPRAAAHFVLAGAELLAHDPNSKTGRRLLTANLRHLPRADRSSSWLWPEPRLTYSNALLPEALLAAGQVLAVRRLVEDGLALLRWLTEHDWSPGGHFSLTPTGGRGPDDPPGFDQQPIEAWALASACARAFMITDDPLWGAFTCLAAQWFSGANDAGRVMFDPVTGAAFDGLTATGVNLNQGAESTISLIGALLARDAVLASASPTPSRSSR